MACGKRWRPAPAAPADLARIAVDFTNVRGIVLGSQLPYRLGETSTELSKELAHVVPRRSRGRDGGRSPSAPKTRGFLGCLIFGKTHFPYMFLLRRNPFKDEQRR